MRDFKFFTEKRQPTVTKPDEILENPARSEMAEQPNPAQSGTVSDADKYKAICELIDNVWNGLTDNMKRKTLRNNQIPDWTEILQCAIKSLPVGYERQREIIETELREYQAKLTKPNNRRKKSE